MLFTVRPNQRLLLARARFEGTWGCAPGGAPTACERSTRQRAGRPQQKRGPLDSRKNF